jgi:hypothetical protein
MSVTSVTNRSFIEAEQYSDFILRTLHDGLLPGGFYRNVTDFGNGEVLNIKTVGEAQIQEVEEDAPIKYSPIETGEVELRITEYVGDGWYVTDKMRQDGAQIEQLMSIRGAEATRAIQEYFETQALKTIADAQVEADPNSVDGFAHRIVPTSTNNTLELGDLIKARLAFNKAEVPMAGRVGIVDPVVEATLNTTFQITSGTGDLAANSTWQMITESGMSKDHSFVINLYGFDIMTSNRLPTKAAGVASDGTTTVTDAAVENIFMCIADDGVKPLMAAWRQMPKVEGDRNKDLQRDEYVQTARFGFGVQRKDTLVVIPTSATNIS